MELRFCDDAGTGGFSWITDEPATRTSHALAVDGRVWLVDPVEWEPALERARALGDLAAVLQLLDRHDRDCATVAARLGIPRLVVPAAIPGSPFQVVEVRRTKRWQEIALWCPGTATLVVAEAVGTNPFFTAGRDPAGIHLLLRVSPPRATLGAFSPTHLLVGHGEGLHGPGAAAGLRQALAHARTGLPRMALKLPWLVLAARRSRRR